MNFCKSLIKTSRTIVFGILILVPIRFISCGRSAPPVAKDLLFPQKPVIKRAIYRDGFLFLLLKMAEDPYISHFSIIDKCSGREEKVKFLKGTETYSFSFQVDRGCEVFISAKNRYDRGESGIRLKIPEEMPREKISDFSVSRFSNRVEIGFENPVLVNIYRDVEELPINEKPLSGKSFIDYNVEGTEQYRYALRTVYYINGIEVEGEMSDWIEVPPATKLLLPPPDEVRAKIEGENLFAEWMPVLNEELLGYNFYVYSKGKILKINETPLERNHFEVKIGKMSVESVGVSSLNKSGIEGEIRWVKIK